MPTLSLRDRWAELALGQGEEVVLSRAIGFSGQVVVAVVLANDQVDTASGRGNVVGGRVSLDVGDAFGLGDLPAAAANMANPFVGGRSGRRSC